MHDAIADDIDKQTIVTAIEPARAPDSFRAGCVQIFISHNNSDAAFALELRDKLRAAGFDAWTYEKDLSFGLDLQSTIQSRIEHWCDVFLLIDSPDARRSKWVARELDLALRAQALHGERSPAILSVKRSGAPDGPFPRRGFRWNFPKRPVDLNATRAFSEANPHTDHFENFLQCLSVEVDYFGAQAGDSERLPEGWQSCYETLFPDINERDDPNNILRWMERDARDDSDWQDLVATLRFFEQVVGFTYLNYRKSDGWIWGSYMGVLRPWRAGHWTQHFLSRVLTHVRRNWTNAQGILYEIDPISEDLCQSALSRLKRGGALTQAELANIRNIKRAELYYRRQALALVGPDGTPVFHKQPYMYKSAGFTGPIRRDREVELILVIYPLVKDLNRPETIRSSIDFTFDMYRQYYGGMPVFDDYIESVRDEVLTKLPRGAHWGSALSENANLLLREATRRKLPIPI
jgi:TIR domain